MLVGMPLNLSEGHRVVRTFFSVEKASPCINVLWSEKMYFQTVYCYGMLCLTATAVYRC